MVFFVFNCLSVYAKIINPLIFLQNKKSSKIDKLKKTAHPKKTSHHKNFKKSIAKQKEDKELKVSILLPDDEKQDYGIPVKNVTYSPALREDIMTEIVSWYDTRYKWGGKSKKGIDCSGFTSLIYEKVLGIIIPRSSTLQFKIGRKIESLQDLKFGDLLFFKSRRRSPGHVGIYIGDGIFAHSSSYKKRGVVTSKLDDPGYLKRYLGARRVLDEPRTVIGGE
jgi:cell wall-associated NlpC family hydrolase